MVYYITLLVIHQQIEHIDGTGSDWIGKIKGRDSLANMYNQL